MGLSDRHFRELKFSGFHGKKGAAAHRSLAVKGHKNVAARPDNATLGIFENQPVRLLQSKLLGDPIFVQGAKRACVFRLEGPDFNL
jgi:hypothetical protein